MKKILVFVLALAIGAAFLAGAAFWRLSKGTPAEALEARYVGPADRFVEVAGARVRIRDEGPPDAPPIVLLHGFTYSLESWDGWASRLSDRWRVIRYDLLGHGLTGPDPLERYAPDERAAFLGEVLNALGLERAVIAGNSLGGLAAWRFAASNPARVEALVLVSPGAFPLNGVTEAPAEIPAALKAYLLTAPEAGVRASAELVFADPSAISSERLQVLRDLMRREGNGAAMIRSLEEFTLPEPTPLLEKIAAPTLILWGEADRLIAPEQGRRLAAAIPDAKLITYPGVGHAAQEEAPEVSVADVIAFLDAIADAPVATGRAALAGEQ